MKKTFDTARIPIGLVGLGLMGCSITACLLMAGHPVMAVAPIPVDLDHAENRIKEHLRGAYREGLIKEAPEYYLKNLTITEDYKDLAGCKLILECTLEDLDIKKAVYLKIETYASRPFQSAFYRTLHNTLSDFLGYTGWSLPTQHAFLK